MTSPTVGWAFGELSTGPHDPAWRPAEWDGDVWESEPVPISPARGLILSWNMSRPAWAGCSFRIAVRIDGSWTDWVPMGEWGQVFPVRQPAASIVRDADTAQWAGVADSIRVRARRTANHRGQVPDVRRVVAAAISNTGAHEPCPGPPGPFSGPSGPNRGPRENRPFVQDVPFRSQMIDDEHLAPRICGPTSLAMHLARHDGGIQTESVATLVYDATRDLYGNWAHLAAVAGEHGFASWVERFRCLADVEARLVAGYGAVLSIAYERGELDGSPIDRTSGHLLVLRGWNPNGDPVCNDPAFPDSRGDGVVYNRAQFERQWLGHGGTAILLRPE